MSSNTENTEAKLAAYIDGTLDPAERAEIEKYLSANPDHQKLLADMTAQRQLLRSLPREKAPAEIYDALQAQLERSILLEDAGSTIAPPVRHSRRSQFMGLAAMLLLAIGLGVVLFFALPTSKPTPTEIAMTPATGRTATATGSAAATTPAEDTRELGLTALGAESKTASSAPAALARTADRDVDGLVEGPPAPTLTGVASNARPVTPTDQALGDIASADKALEKETEALDASASANQRLVVLVSTDNPSHATQQVASYLQSNKITFESVDPAAQSVQSQAADSAALYTLQTKDRFYAQRQAPGAPAGSAVGGVAAKRESQSAAGETPQVAKNYLDNLDPAPRYILARGMTRQQAADLTNALAAAANAPRQRARLLIETRDGQPSISIGASQLTYTRARRTQEQQPSSQASTAPADRAESTVDIDRQPSTATTEPDVVSGISPTTSATTAPLSATTRPTTAESLDVVIMVEPAPAASPSTTPAAPATTSPSDPDY